MASPPNLHELIAAHPGMAHSAWVAQHLEATLQERDLMLKRFERIGRKMLEEWNQHRRHYTSPRPKYPIPGEPGFGETDNFAAIVTAQHYSPLPQVGQTP